MIKFKDYVIANPDSILSFHWEAPNPGSEIPGVLAIQYSEAGKTDYIIGSKRYLSQFTKLYSEWKTEDDKKWRVWNSKLETEVKEVDNASKD